MKNKVFTAAILSSLLKCSIVLANESSFLDESISNKTAVFTKDPESASGKAARGFIEATQIKSTQIEPTYVYAASMVYKKDQKPETRQILIDTVLKKIKAHCKDYLLEDIQLLGHEKLFDHGWSLKNFFDCAADAFEEKKPRLYYYIYSGTWKEMAALIPDYADAEQYIALSKAKLEVLSNTNSKSYIYLGLIALKEGKQEDAYSHLLNDKLIEALKASSGTDSFHYKALDFNWLEGAKKLIELSSGGDFTKRLKLLSVVGELYKTIGNTEEAFAHTFEAYKIARQLKMPPLETAPLLNLCNECALASETSSSYESNDVRMEKRRKNAQNRLHGYQLHSYLAEEYEKIAASYEGMNDDKNEQAKSDKEKAEKDADVESNIAYSYLKRSILEGNNELLETLLDQSHTIFHSTLEAARFLQNFIQEEHEKWQKSEQGKYGYNYKLYKMFEDLDRVPMHKFVNTLTQLFLNDGASEEVKHITALSLFRLHNAELSSIASEMIVMNEDNKTVRFLNEQKDTIVKFFRELKVDKNDKDFSWISSIQEELEKIFIYGVTYKHYGQRPNSYEGNWGLISEKTVIAPEKK